MHPLPRSARRLSLQVLALAPASGLGPAQQAQIGTLSLPRALEAFAELEEACARDGGALWGVDLYGPVLLVDPLTRRLACNLADEDGLLTERDGIFVGTLPAD